MKLFSIASIGVLIIVVFAVGTEAAYAGYEREYGRDYPHREYGSRGSVLDRLESQLDRQFAGVCRLVGRFGFATVPSICEDEEPEPEPEAPVLDLEADPETIEAGATSTLFWESDNADVCEADDGWSGDKALDGMETVSPGTTTTYTLTCSGEGGTTAESVTVTVIPAEPEPEEPTLSLDADPMHVPTGSTSTLSWNSEHADVCEASDGWIGNKALDGMEIIEVNATTTYTLTCSGGGGTTTESVTVTAFEEGGGPVPSPDHLVISEVFYDVDDAHGSEGDNEWVEIYNPTGSAVDLMDWMLGESTTTADVIATTSHMLMPGNYLLVTDATTTALFWDLTLVDVVYLRSPITTSGLSNEGEYIALFDPGSEAVDAVSYGTDEEAFSPSVPVVDEGHSIARSPVDTDTDTAADWADSDAPTSGS